MVKDNLHVLLEPKQAIHEATTMRIHTLFRLANDFTPQPQDRYLTCLTQSGDGQEHQSVLTVVDDGELGEVRWTVFPATIARRTVETAYVSNCSPCICRRLTVP